MAMMHEAQARLVCRLYSGPIESTAEELILELGIQSEGILGQIAELARLQDMYGIDVLPPLHTGEIASVRLLRIKSRTPLSLEDEVQSLMKTGESANCELKSTLHFDFAKFKAVPTLDAGAYRSELVLHASLKSIAALLNGEGGRLYLGIADDYSLIGLEHDFRLAATPNSDKWELFLRDTIRGRFKDGALINDYIRVRFGVFEGRTVCAIEVDRRGALSIVRDPKGAFQIFSRQGNRTELVDMSGIEEFIDARRTRLAQQRVLTART